MADQNPQHGRRQHFHRGRRGPDRRGNERRGPNPAPSSETGAREHREHVDVEQIMREIRSRISQRHGVDLTTQQIQELAARRLEAILEPRTMKPSLLEQVRRGTSTPLDAPPAPEPTYSFDDSTLYESHRGFIRFMRRLLNPLLKLFFNPNPVIAALNTQARLNQAAVQREMDRDRRQAEWNALHYEILQRLVLEVSRTSLDAQQLSMRIEALSAKVDFAERRARNIEGTLHQTRPAPRQEPGAPVAQPAQPSREPGHADVAAPPAGQEGTSEGRRRRRRRRGRRSQGFPASEGAAVAATPGAVAAELPVAGSVETPFADEAEDDEGGSDAGDDGQLLDVATPAEGAVRHEEPAEAEAGSRAATVPSTPDAVQPAPSPPSPETATDSSAGGVSEEPRTPTQPTDPIGD